MVYRASRDRVYIGFIGLLGLGFRGLGFRV